MAVVFFTMRKFRGRFRLLFWRLYKIWRDTRGLSPCNADILKLKSEIMKPLEFNDPVWKVLLGKDADLLNLMQEETLNSLSSGAVEAVEVFCSLSHLCYYIAKGIGLDVPLSIFISHPDTLSYFGSFNDCFPNT